MAVLQKIRQRSGLLLLVIGFALLAFVVGEAIQSGGFNSPSKDVGSINGKDVPFEDFRMKVANMEKSGQGTTQTQAANQLWEQEIAIALLSAEFDKLGLRAGENHIIENFKNDPNIGQNPAFLNELGKFDLKKFKEYFKTNPEQAQMMKDREKDAELNAKYQMYAALIKGGMYTTEAEGKFKYELESNKTSFDYVALLYSTVKDSDIKVTDEDYVAYMKKHEKRFKSDGTREIEYVVIEDTPSKEDQTEAKAKIDALLTGGVVFNNETKTNDTIPSFKNASNVAEYIAANSDTPYDSTYVSKQDLPAEHAEALFNLPVGEVYGPYITGKYYAVSKSMGRKSGAKAKASHILISWEGTQVPNKKEKRTKEEAKVKAESLLAQAVANPGSFTMLALTNSDDSSAQSGGDLGYFGPNQMVKPFNDFVFANPIGKIGLVETEFGYHIINVTDKQDAVRLATVSQKVDPSQKTTDDAYTKATKFEMDAASKDFAVVAKSAGVTVNPAIKAKPMDEMFGSVGNQRQIVKWAYSEAKVGDVKRFEIVNVGHVIAKLTKINEKGLMTVEEAKPMIESIIKNEKKAEKLKAKASGSSLEAIAKANATTVQQAVDVTIGNPVLNGVGAEQKVVGTAFGTAAGKLSAPIEGNSGIYVIKAKSVLKAPKAANYTDYVNKVKAMSSQGVGRVIPALKSDAKIEDNRLEFY
ncbi:peptidylprolyl isomerase [Flavobacterium aquatile]|uniref:Peptidylprolyl isomerase n=1 Tax=Flavobacterium aquatile LMG 4008 = ATCC 11947 TaxID=1453498 RepID=A0A095STJ5_9FLAO|nr:peptidylprolyl isomerase [Flavobacterium aquatile]KGD67917.1 peptidylprolyl isomerase [Flavobacterium aquatile LMG 4008 = ATCC 11947]OXA65408.1 peptidylprolyl isomerase [Flavobacterium aquatile LMG 4008 = ATCC 11947]GEC78968.1 peptidylprolyl isomerase [Flavobacterium aquatile]